MKRLLSIVCAVALLLGLPLFSAPPAAAQESGTACPCGDTCSCAAVAFGDVNGDGAVNTTDARLVLQYGVQKITADGLNLPAAEVSGDGTVNTTDARLILQYAVGKITAFPVGDRMGCGEDCADCGAGTVRNIALNRAVYQSSSANDDNTGHLVTNGILRQTEDAGNPSVTAQYTNSPSGEGPDYAFDGLTSTKYFSYQSPAWVEYRFADGQAYTVTQYAITTANDVPDRDPKSWRLYGVTDSGTLVEIAVVTDHVMTEDRYTKVTFDVATPGAYKAYRLQVTAVRNGGNMQFAELDLLDADGYSVITPYVMPHDNSWKSAGGSNEYLYIDLGGESRFDNVRLYWDKVSYATEYEIQVSNDAVNWTTVYQKTGGKGGEEDITFAPVTAAYVKLLAKRSAGAYFRLFAFEVYGQNDVRVQAETLPAPEADGTQYLRGGNWRVQRASEVEASGEELSSAAYTEDDNWLVATVPGTVLVSYLNAGAIPDPYYGDQNNQISDSFFTADFWYTDSMTIPAERQGQRVFLNFESINWKADVYLNGQSLGSIRGAFIRGRFDVTDLVRWGEENYLAVYIHANETPDTLCFDNPTIEPSAQWDWVKRIRGRDIGLYGDVYVSYAGDVQLIDPWIETHPDLTDYSTAELIFRTDVKNTTDRAVTATVRGVITPSNLTYERQVTVPAGGVAAVEIPLTMQEPQLWWPNRYGDQFLYTNETTVEINGEAANTKTFRFGVREITYEEDTARPLKMYVNGVRIYCTGGNWGMDEALLRCNTAEDYDIRLRLHKEENFNMIRNWGGQTYNEEFYNACDKYGILVFDDFWMAAGEWQAGFSGLPNDVEMFVANAMEKVRNIALNRAAYQSGAANSNNTGHLVTDGVIHHTEDLDNPVVTSQHADSPAGESAEYAFDGRTSTKHYTHQCPAWVEYRFPGDRAYTVAGYAITTANDMPDRDPKSWTLYGVKEGGELVAVDTVTDYTFPTERFVKATFAVASPGEYKAYRLDVTAVRGGSNMQFAELAFLDADGNPIHTPYIMPYDDSWRSKSAANEYLYIDLGGKSRFDNVRLYWDKISYAVEYELQISDNAVDWTTVYRETNGKGGEEDITFPPVTATYVKLLAKRSAGSHFKLFAFEVYGQNDVRVQAAKLPPPEADGRQYLRGGNWRLQRASEVEASGEELSSAAYADDDWIIATVPGTVLVSYLNIGAIPDPYYGDQNNQISDSFFTADFWYRDSLPIPAARRGQRVFLNFDRINWKVDVYLNGHAVGRIEGAFMRGKFDVTDLVRWGEENYLAVRIYANDTPDALRYDNPTIEPSAQWDWVPRIRGRDIGIYGDVYVSYAGEVQLIDPWIETHPDLTDYSTAKLILRTEVKNAADREITATVRGSSPRQTSPMSGRSPCPRAGWRRWKFR